MKKSQFTVDTAPALTDYVDGTKNPGGTPVTRNWTYQKVRDLFLTETSGTTALSLGSIGDTQYLLRSGTTIVGGASVVTLSGTQTLTNKRVSPRAGTIALSGTPAINTDLYDYVEITGTGTISSMSGSLSGTPLSGDKLWFAFTSAGTVVITWGTSFENGAVTLAGTITTPYDVAFKRQGVDSKWRAMAQG